MKIPIIYLLMLTVSSAFAESPFLRELTQLTAQRDQALTAAAEPINRRYKEGLETVLRHATQASDLDAAIKIQEALKALGVKDPATAAIAAPAATRIINTTWIWYGGQTITFQNGGKARWSVGQTWTWEPGSDANIIKGETAAHQPFTFTFNPDFKTGTIQGAVNTETHRVQK